MEQVTRVDTFIDVILYHLNTKQSFAFNRYGDGEAIILDDNNKLLNFVLERQLGYVPEKKDIELIKENLIKAYSYSNMLGIPEERHTNRVDEWKNTIQIFKNKVGEKVLLNTPLTSVDIIYECLNQSLLAKMNVLYRDSFEELFKDRKKLNYISCRNLDKQLKDKYNINEINSFIIAPEMKFTDYKGEKHYPDQYNKIYKWIQSVTSKGDLCLVGAGVVGKIYNNWFSDNGGISLDFGAVFDLLAGKNTRGKNRGKNVEDNTYKI